MNAPQGIKQIHMAEIYPLIRQTLSDGGSFRLTITGTSMFPTLLGGRDRVTLIQPPTQLKKYDLPLYLRRDGSFILHRIVATAADGSYICCGDHQWILEQGIRHAQIIGVVSEIERKGKQFSADDRRYCRWVRFWVRVLPLRRLIFRIYGILGRIKRVFHRKKKV